MTVYMGRIANQRKVPKWLPFKNYKSESLNINGHMWGAYVHTHTKCEVSVFKPVARRGVHRRCQRRRCTTDKALWLIKQMSEKCRLTLLKWCRNEAVHYGNINVRCAIDLSLKHYLNKLFEE